MTKFSTGPRLPIPMVQNVKSELRYLLKLVHLQNDRLRHPPQWSHSLFLPLLGQRVPPPPSFDLGCCSHFHTVPSSADCPQFQVRCGGPSGHLFLTGSKLTCLCLADSRQDEPTILTVCPCTSQLMLLEERSPARHTSIAVHPGPPTTWCSFCQHSHHASLICLYSSLRESFPNILYLLQPQICPAFPSQTLVSIFAS